MPISISDPVAKASAHNRHLDLKLALQEHGRQIGFDIVRVVDAGHADFARLAGRLNDFLEAGRHGDMDWMAGTAERRADPRALWPSVRSIIMVGQSYAPENDPLDALQKTSCGAISAYAQRRDYHDVIKSRLKALGGWLAQAAAADIRVFVDTAPLMEKPLAAAAGIGWQGKHTNLVSREFGSWLLLGAILTDAEIEADQSEVDHCGSCSRCLDICPTAAFPAPYQLDARRCLAYLTIEHKGHIARPFRRPMGNRIFGCDDCLAVCPWNKFASAAHDAKLAARDDLDAPPLGDLLILDDAAFRLRFAGTPIKRTGRDRFVRNVVIAAGNAEDGTLKPAVAALLADQSALVRAMAVWAIRRLCGNAEEFGRLREAHFARERDAAVIDEWTHQESS